MQTVFKLQLVDLQGRKVTFLAGGPAERDLIHACTEAIVEKGVGFLKTEKQVRQAIEAGITEVIHGLKQDSRYAIG